MKGPGAGLCLRPFVDPVAEAPPFAMCGAIEGGSFVVTVLGYAVPMATVAARWAEPACAWVEPGRIALPNGLRVTVAAEQEEGMPPGARLEVRFEGDAIDEQNERIRWENRGETLHLPELAGVSCVVHFDGEGRVTGRDVQLRVGRAAAIN